jgi:hypothetical protein
MEQRGDLTGALLAALLVRHLSPDDDLDRSLGFNPFHLYRRLSPTAQKAFLGITGSDTALRPLDDILAYLKLLIDDSAHGGTPT